MGKIVKFIGTNFIIKQAQERGKSMYEELVSSLKTNPANSYSIQEVENLADRVLKDGGYSELIGPTPIVAIAKQFGIYTFKESNMPEDISGNIFVGGTTKDIYHTDKVIVVGSDEEYFHQRFIIAHELAHYLIDYLGNPDFLDQRILFQKTYPKNNHNSQDEIRADRFAAELLMPATLFSKRYLKAMENSDCNRKYAIAYLSDFFETKKSSIERRIEEVLS